MENDALTFVIVAFVAIVALILIWLYLQRRKSMALRDRFGEEYDRTVDTRGSRTKGEADLLEREKRVKTFDIRPLGPDERARFTGEWQETKALFVDSPVEAIDRADRLLATIMKTRGYPMADFEHRHADLTVDHGDVATHYLAGHEIADRAGRGDATTEELRRAMNHYERLFDHLVRDSAASRPVSAPADPRG
jgi:hypothetical protein